VANYLYLAFDLVAIATGLWLAYRYLRTNDPKDPPVHRYLGLNGSFWPAFWRAGTLFLAWGVITAGYNHRIFNNYFMTGPELYNLPFEEILFIGALPFLALTIHRVIHRYIPGKTRSQNWPFLLLAGAASSLALLLAYPTREFTVTLMIVTLYTALRLSRSPILSRKSFWLFQPIAVLLGFLTGLFWTIPPVISLEPGVFIGWHLGVVPIEHIIYTVVLINLFLVHAVPSKY
jgi:hypothetical protein